MLHVPGLFITHSEGRGRGVFTAAELTPGDLIEFCPLILIPEKDKDCIHKSHLHDYYFLSPEQILCIALGYGSIYNHHTPANAEIVFDIPNKNMEIHCTHAIAAGEEIFIDYTGGLKDAPELWFKPL